MEQGGNVSVEGSASDGRCGDSCDGGRLGLFLVIIAVGLFFIFVLHIPDVIITIRYVIIDCLLIFLSSNAQSCFLLPPSSSISPIIPLSLCLSPTSGAWLTSSGH